MSGLQNCVPDGRRSLLGRFRLALLAQPKALQQSGHGVAEAAILELGIGQHRGARPANPLVPEDRDRKSRARDAYLAERRRELIAGAVAEGTRQQDAVILADACVGAARRIMTELLAQRAGVPRGRA